jgi:hypothetical protein
MHNCLSRSAGLADCIRTHQSRCRRLNNYTHYHRPRSHEIGSVIWDCPYVSRKFHLFQVGSRAELQQWVFVKNILLSEFIRKYLQLLRYWLVLQRCSILKRNWAGLVVFYTDVREIRAGRQVKSQEECTSKSIQKTLLVLYWKIL